MYKSVLAAAFAILFAGGDALAQHGGGHGGGGGGRGGAGGGGFRGGYGGGYRGGYGGYGRGFYGGYGGWGYGGYGWGYPLYLGGYGYGYYPYDGGYYPYYDSGFSYDTTSGGAIIPYSSVYPPAATATIDPNSTGSSSFSPPASPPATLAPASATVAVIVPQGGQVWFNGELNPPRNGSKWIFTSKDLDRGKTYVLEIKARWNDGVNDQSYKIPLRMEAGDNMTVDLTKIR
jgi:hypothetical protein